MWQHVHINTNAHVSTVCFNLGFTFGATQELFLLLYSGENPSNSSHVTKFGLKDEPLVTKRYMKDKAMDFPSSAPFMKNILLGSSVKAY